MHWVRVEPDVYLPPVYQQRMRESAYQALVERGFSADPTEPLLYAHADGGVVRLLRNDASERVRASVFHPDPERREELSDLLRGIAEEAYRQRTEPA